MDGLQSNHSPMFLGFLLLPAAIFSVCNDPDTIRNSHVFYSTTDRCLIMVDCVIENHTNDNGGAVSCTAAEQDVTINGSSFLSCSATTSGGGCYLHSSKCVISCCCVSDCSAGKTGNSFYFGGSDVRWIEIVGIERSSPNSKSLCYGGLHFASEFTVNLSCVNITSCYADHYSCVSSMSADHSDVHPVSLTGQYLNIFKNSGELGFYRAAAVGESGWYLWFCNFYGNEITTGVLGAVYNAFGMTVTSCIFSGNKADIGTYLWNGIDDDDHKFKLTNCIFSGNFPSATLASSENCKSSATTQLWFLSTRLCPTYSASKSASRPATSTSTPTSSASASASLAFTDSTIVHPSMIVHPSAVFVITLGRVETASLSVSHTIQESQLLNISVKLVETDLWSDSCLAATLAFIQTAPLLSQDPGQSDLGSSAGLIVGIVISIVAILIGVIVGFFLLWRTRRSRAVESESSSGRNRSVMNLDFIDDHINDGEDTVLTTYTGQFTNEGNLPIPASIPTNITVNLTDSLLG
jgi:hypothetical protein